MQKQDTSSFRSSSYHQEKSPNNLQAKRIGCMSGIFHFIYKYSNRRGKFITSGKKQENNIIISSLSSSSSKQQQQQQQQQESSNKAIGSNNTSKFTRLTCNVQRSPTLPAEIRRGNNNMKTTEEEEEDFLDEAAEKRRKLIEALEKCDKDLKELKKIIDVVRSSVSVVNKINGDLQPSPVSVLDDLAPFSSTLKSGGGGGGSYPWAYAHGRAVQQQKQKKKPGEEDDIMNMSTKCLLEKMKSEAMVLQGKSYCASENMSPTWGSKAMIDSVNEVSKDIEWGERREIKRIGFAVQDLIFRDLIDEFVKEFGSFSMYSLPFDACRRCLRF